ncbi:hypothetical protein L6164_031341 [Bauhinia variegata]|uniref:Uncharacterized protein n=1 Tax=Bauhinia variegata TaxID=167791 RepID=A0ACB9LFL6_BAUVA|nr:hypothetical protein L6164_031341 [Bauhinia variegata]
MDQRPAKLGDPLVLEEVTAQDETVHLAVKGNQFETQLMQLMERLKTLTDQRLKEAEGFNMLFSELAEAIKQREVQDLFKEKGKTGAGNAEPRIHISEEGDGKEMKTKKETTMNDLSYDLENLILIVATLLTTVTYEAVLSPPPYIWKEGTKFDYGCLFRKSKHMFSIHRFYVLGAYDIPPMSSTIKRSSVSHHDNASGKLHYLAIEFDPRCIILFGCIAWSHNLCAVAFDN